MSYKTAACAAALCVVSTISQAQQFGGELGVSFATPSESSDLNITEYFGAVEYNINRQFSVGADLASYTFEGLSEDFVSSTLHLTYHLDGMTSVGVFTGRDAVADSAVSTVSTSRINGLEVGTAFDQFEVEGYIGLATGGTEDLTLVGIDGSYHVNDQISASAELDFANGDDLDFTRFAIGGVYKIENGPELFGQIGQRSADVVSVSDDSMFIELGATIKFGTNRGTTFDRRSLFNGFPNF